MPPDKEEEGQRGLTRDRLVEAALELIQEDGLDGLSMRALAERLEVKAASLYWHVRDREELLELLAGSILDSVPRPRPAAGWRPNVIAMAAALESRVSSQKDASRVLLESPDVLGQSETFAAMTAQLQVSGLQQAEAAEVARMAITHVIAGRTSPGGDVGDSAAATSDVASIAIDTGSRGVVLRTGSTEMETLIRVPHERSTAAPAVVRGETVIVRRLRGVGRGEIELNPRRSWKVRVQAPTWNTVLEVGGLDVREIHVDSGAAKVECFLPRPRGVVPIHISSGVVGVVLHRPAGSALVADISTGAVKVKLDDFAIRTSVTNVHWESEGASTAADRYELQISSGAVKIDLDTYAASAPPASIAAPVTPGSTPVSALDILLDGVESRVKSR